MENNNLELIEGEFTHTIYRNESYMVSRFLTQEGTITVTGPSFSYEPKQKYILSGTFVDHPKYGFQFNLLTIDKKIPDNKDEIISFLKNKSFKGIGKKAAEKIYAHFGSETLRILKEEPQRIREVDLSEKQYLSLEEGFENLNDPENDILFYLVSNGFSNYDAQKIFNRFKLSTKEVGQDNPFRYYCEVYGISFDKVRRFAEKLEFSDAEKKYKEAYLVYLLNEYTFNSGDLYLSKEQFLNILQRQGPFSDFEEVLSSCLEHSYLYQEEDRIYLFNDYQDECFTADFLKHFKQDLSLDELQIKEGIESCENELKINYSEKQKEAISDFFTNSFSIINGGPGTGKTTIIQAMAKIFTESFPFHHLIIAAPTGRAAKRISEICQVEAKTIHSLLRWDKESNTFVFGADNPILYDAIIIDEFSMVDSSLFASLLKAGSHLKKICIIGDNHQLPSIRPGNLLDDLIHSELFDVTSLEYNYRQKNGNEIISLAQDIIHDKLDLSKYGKDIHFYNINHNNFDLISLIKEDMEQGYSLNDIQVLTPMYKGDWGIDHLNVILQEAFNQKDNDKKQMHSGKYLYREQDKILQLKNRPADDVYNGDIGILEEINKQEEYFLINYDGTYVFYSFDELSDLSLAYAMSVHKAQGSEYPIVYFVFNKYNIHMLNRNLIYTAISRAKKKLVLIGEENLLERGIHYHLKQRNTTLKGRLKNE